MSKPTKRKATAGKTTAPKQTARATAGNARVSTPIASGRTAQPPRTHVAAKKGSKTVATKKSTHAKSTKAAAHRPNPSGPTKTVSSNARSLKATNQRKAAPVQTGPLNQSVLWTKDAPKGTSGSQPLPVRIVGGIVGFFALIFKTIGRIFASLFGYIFSLVSRSKIAIVSCVLLLVLFGVGMIDFGLNWGKIYPGVKVGELDLSGKSVEEAQTLIEETYGPRLAETNVYIFANEEAAADVETARAQTEAAEADEVQSIEEARANKVLWITDASMLSAHVATDGLVKEAIEYGRENGSIFNRIGAMMAGHTIEPYAEYDPESIEALAADIDASIGDPRVNANIAITGGTASVVEGRDGTMIDRENFKAELDAAFLSEDTPSSSFIAQIEYAPLQITREQAQEVCDQVNQAISKGAEFKYEGASWVADAETLGSWIQTKVVQVGDTWELEPYVDNATAKGIILSHLKANITGGDFKVRFAVEGGQPMVVTDAEGTIPLVGDAVTTLDGLLFPEASEGADQPPDSSMPVIAMQSTAIPETLTFETALENGIISNIAEYTTEYTSGALGRNHNIHLAADILSNSIIAGNGGTWSFNNVAGNCNEAAGFQSAGTIQNGEYVDDIGGGICQVATTLFNAVYEAGYPVVERHNHSLYSASYPDGRDAAVSWPDLNFVWKNDSPSDVLVRFWYTDTTVTAALYGVSPEYQVETVVGEWQAGEKYKTRTTVDDTLAPGDSYIKSNGTDGSKITVYRTVKDKNGVLLHEDVFSSVYDPKDEVKVEGPKAAESGNTGT